MLCQILADIMIRLHSVVKSHSRVEQQRQVGGIRRGVFPWGLNLARILREGPTAECEKCRGGK